MNPLSPAPSAVEAREYLIDHFRVSFLSNAAWKCACHEFAAANSCRHTREAAGMREAQALIKVRVQSGASGLRTLRRRKS